MDGKSDQGTVHIEDEIALAIEEEDVVCMSENDVVDIDDDEVDGDDEGGFCGFDLNEEAKADDEGVNNINLEAEDRVPINAGEKRIGPANVEEWKKMWFTTVSEARLFYDDYAHREGFSTRLRYSNMSRRKNNPINKYMWVVFVCNREGFRRNGPEKPKSPDGKAAKNPNKNPKPRTKPQLKKPETRIGCTAKFRIQLNGVANQYYITHWEGTHNHVLNPKEDAHLLISNRKVTPATAMMMEMNAAAGISLRSSFEIICATTGGVENVGCTKVDHKNHLAMIRKRKMVRGEATAISEYLREKTKNSPGFWYEIEVDSEENMANIFWADQRMRDDYSCFGDSITFDTTYRTNKDYCPLGNFNF
ncbi:Protein FAR1-RELATED SEQUENCE 5, partial [Linum grandiflorum]